MKNNILNSLITITNNTADNTDNITNLKLINTKGEIVMNLKRFDINTWIIEDDDIQQIVKIEMDVKNME